MWYDLVFTFLFIAGVYYLLRYSYIIMSAVERSKEAVYPRTDEEFKNIIIPNEWKEMKPLTKNTKSYKLVQWGTAIAIVVLGILFIFVLVADVHSSFFSFVYLFGAIITAVRHPGNLFILPEGIIFHGKSFAPHQVLGYKIEQIIRWHALYGLDPRINDGYKLTIKYKVGKFQFSNFVVIREMEQLEKIEALLNKQGIRRLPEENNEVSDGKSLGTNKE